MIDRAAVVLALVASSLGLLGIERTARADDPAPHDRASVLFDEARDLMGQGLFGDACPKLAESLRLEPAGRTKLALAMCHESEGRLATALTDFEGALAQARTDGRADRVTLAEERARAIEARVSRVTIVVTEPDVSVAIDATIVPHERLSAPLPIDGGTHDIRATAAGRAPWQTTLVVASAGESPRVVVPALRPLSTPAPPPRAEEPPPRTSYGSLLPMAVSGGIGLVAAGAGAYFGVTALQKQSDASPYCHDTACSQTGVDLVHDAKGRALVADIAFGVAAVALAVSTYFLVRAISPKDRARESASRANLFLGATW